MISPPRPDVPDQISIIRVPVADWRAVIIACVIVALVSIVGTRTVDMGSPGACKTAIALMQRGINDADAEVHALLDGNVALQQQIDARIDYGPQMHDAISKC